MEEEVVLNRTLREVAKDFAEQPAALHAIADHYRAYLEYEETRQFLRELPKLEDSGPVPERETLEPS